jgi:hypothetical protein
MMKKFLLLTLAAALLGASNAKASSNLSFKGPDRSFEDSSKSAIPTMPDLLTEITSAVGLQNNFILQEGDVKNIQATISHHKRLITYNPVFMQSVNEAMGNKWGSIALIAHELGHHVNGHTLQKSGSEPELELEADEFAGYVLRTMGASLSEAQRVMYYISTNQASKTHPARADRLLAIRKGWEKGTPKEIVVR